MTSTVPPIILGSVARARLSVGQAGNYFPNGDHMSESGFLSIAAAVEVAKETLLQNSQSSSFAALATLASLRLGDRYYHSDLASRLDDRVLQHAVAKLHEQTLIDWLKTPLEAQKTAVRDHLCSRGYAALGEVSLHSFVGFIPDSAQPPEQQLFEADLSVILMVLRAERDPKLARISPYTSVWRTLMTIKASFCDANMTLRDAARAIGVSPNHLGLLFLDYTGLAFHRYLLAIRMFRATNLLKLQTTPVGQIAITLGYCNASNFYRDFRRVFGKSPTAYLKDVQEADRSVGL